MSNLTLATLVRLQDAFWSESAENQINLPFLPELFRSFAKLESGLGGGGEGAL